MNLCLFRSDCPRNARVPLIVRQVSGRRKVYYSYQRLQLPSDAEFFPFEHSGSHSQAYRLFREN